MRDTHIVILSTGGTIASRHDPKTGRTQIVSSARELVEAVPEIAKIARVEVETVFTVASFRIQPSDIQTLAEAVQRHLARGSVAGVVITHGTDTMEESSFLLDLLVETDNKPVVFTGAQLSSDMNGSDGPRNLINAVRVAASDKARDVGVVVAFADSIFAARDVTKQHTARLEAFTSTRNARLGEIARDDIRIHFATRRRPTFAVDALVSNIALIRLAMGSDADYLRYCLDRGVRGIVIQAFGIGNASPEIVDLVGNAAQQYIPVVITSRCFAGSVVPVYGHGGGQDLFDAGAIFASDLAGEKARLALMVLLARYDDLDSVKQQMALIAA